jgi:elongation factor Ts
MKLQLQKIRKRKNRVEIKATQVKELRDLTGIGMMECKKALIDAKGDLEKAIDVLRSKSALQAEKKSERVAAEGILVSTVTESYATIVEINTETDFAAKDSSFLSFAEKVKTYITENKVTDISYLEDSNLEDERKTLIQTIGENIQLRRIETISFTSEMKKGLYMHFNSKLAAIVITKDGSDEVARNIAMHVSAFNPLCLSEDDIDKDVLEREKAIFVNQAQESDKPQEIMDKMVEGKVKKFLSEVSLLSQDFLKDSEITVQEYLNQNGAIALDFVRLKVGEGIEVETKDFAEEVAEQLK